MDEDAKGDLHEFTIRIKYPPKLECSEETLVGEFNSLWSSVTKKWIYFKTTKPESTRMKRFWTEIISQYAIDYPNICDLLLLLLSVSPGTGPVERSFSKLAKICYKDRGNMLPSTLQNLYLLSSMGIK